MYQMHGYQQHILLPPRLVQSIVYMPTIQIQQPIIQMQSRTSQSSVDQRLIENISRKIENIDSRISMIQNSLSPNRAITESDAKSRKSYYVTKYDNSQERIRLSKKLLDETKETNRQLSDQKQYNSRQRNGESQQYNSQHREQHDISIYKKTTITKKYTHNGQEMLYEGSLDAQGRREGMGTLFDKQGRLIYTGMWSQDVYWGKGKLLFYDGQNRIKSIHMNQFNNFEQIKYNKDSYSGDFIKGQIMGIGRMTFSDRNNNYIVYYGNFKNGIFHGKGAVLQETSNYNLEGEWINGKYQ